MLSLRSKKKNAETEDRERTEVTDLELQKSMNNGLTESSK